MDIITSKYLCELFSHCVVVRNLIIIVSSAVTCNIATELALQLQPVDMGEYFILGAVPQEVTT